MRLDKNQTFDVTRVPVDALGDAKLERLLAYWQARRGERTLPLRSDLLPEDMGDLLGRIALVEIRGGGWLFRFRLAGTLLGPVFGMDLTGRDLDDLEPRGYRTVLIDLFRAAVDFATPQCREIEIRRGRRSFTYRCLVLPVTQRGEDVDMLLVATNWGSAQAPMVDLLRPLPD